MCCIIRYVLYLVNQSIKHDSLSIPKSDGLSITVDLWAKFIWCHGIEGAVHLPWQHHIDWFSRGNRYLGDATLVSHQLWCQSASPGSICASLQQFRCNTVWCHSGSIMWISIPSMSAVYSFGPIFMPIWCRSDRILRSWFILSIWCQSGTESACN